MNDNANPKMTEWKPLACGDCIHCQPGPNTKNDVLSRVCYRHPPVPALIGTEKGPAVISIRAEIRVDTFACGEYDDGTDDEDASVGVVVGVKP